MADAAHLEVDEGISNQLARVAEASAAPWVRCNGMVNRVRPTLLHAPQSCVTAALKEFRE